MEFPRRILAVNRNEKTTCNKAIPGTIDDGLPVLLFMDHYLATHDPCMTRDVPSHPQAGEDVGEVGFGIVAAAAGNVRAAMADLEVWMGWAVEQPVAGPEGGKEVL